MRAAAFAFLVLAACAPTSPQEAQDAAAAGCSAQSTGPWRPAGQAPLVISAAANGPSCADAVATLTIANAAGVALWTQAYPVAQVMSLADRSQNPEALREALDEWINPDTIGTHTTSDLPAWGEGQEAPASGEFPFYPEEGIDRAAYEALRAAALPTFCHVQGMESIACVALENGRVRKIGLQTFPG
ncbi:MAG: hypothetical protein AB7O04_03420 [Hyphomonadaceae bacterium]